ncbi:MAG: alpha/beta fold hydrolase [Flavobacteriaceae bacterium]|nr:alpha/beta fold hydrolase [Flavobacteriaceae bacterium]
MKKTKNKYHLTTIKQLQDKTYSKNIEDFYNAGKEGTFNGKADIEIYYKIFEQENTDKVILISTGRTEATIKYKELVFDLFNNGYSVYIHDHRGQGQSGRMTEDHDMGYIDDFQYYIDDMKSFYDTYIKPNNYKKTFLLTHSMGGAIGMTYLEQNANDFNAAAFSSPMLGFAPPGCTVVKIMAGEKPKYAFGQSKYNDDKSTFNGNTLTGSQIRYERMIEAFDQVPKAKLGGATFQWANKSCQQFDYIFDNVDKLNTPFVLFSAKNEQIVDPSAHQKFIDAAKASGKEHLAYSVANAQHELLIEKDEQRIETINEILKFYAKY